LDEFFLFQIDGHPKLLNGFTSSPEEIRELNFIWSNFRTALPDGIYLAMDHLRTARNPRRVLLVISDCADYTSRHAKSEIVGLVRESDAQVHTIAIADPLASVSFPLRILYQRLDERLLNELTNETGGRHFSVKDMTELPDAAAKIGIALRNQYVLEYNPKNPARDGKYRSVQVEIVPPRGLPPLSATSRPGYYASAR
jgi:Ca-activated chloride channel family protein